MIDRAASIFAALSLAIALAASGLVACAAFPATTETLARASANEGASPFSEEELVSSALLIRDYTVGSHDRRALARGIVELNERAETPYAATDPENAFALPQTHSLSPDAVAHLDDVNVVITNATYALAAVACLALALIVALGTRCGARRVGGVFAAAGSAVLAAFALLGIWALADFDGFFAAFHSLFFASGSWTFPSDSLLITSLPTAFWVGMGIIWLVTSTVLSILCICIGMLLRRTRRATTR